MNELFTSSEFPSNEEKRVMWNEIESTFHTNNKTNFGNLHWRSFWVGNAAAILIGFAFIGVLSIANLLTDSKKSSSSNEQMYETLNTATNELRNLPPILIDQASEANKSSLESTTMAIEEIDRLIIEIKLDMNVYGETPSKRANLKRLYATKLDFYKDLLLNEETQS